MTTPVTRARTPVFFKSQCLRVDTVEFLLCQRLAASQFRHVRVTCARDETMMSGYTIFTQVVALVGALGLGSTLGQYVSSSKDRRETRANALSALADTEAARWLLEPGERIPAQQLDTSIHKLQAAALVARIPREAVQEYAMLARAAHWICDSYSEPTPGFDLKTDLYLNTATRTAAEALANIIWSRQLMQSRRWRHAKKQIDGLLAQAAPGARDAVERSRESGLM